NPAGLSETIKSMITKTVRSRFNHEIGGRVEGCVILEKKVIIPPDPSIRRLGVYDYLVEAPPAPASATPKARAAKVSSARSAPESGSYTRATPDEVGGVIRRVPSR